MQQCKLEEVDLCRVKVWVGLRTGVLFKNIKNSAVLDVWLISTGSVPYDETLDAGQTGRGKVITLHQMLIQQPVKLLQLLDGAESACQDLTQVCQVETFSLTCYFDLWAALPRDLCCTCAMAVVSYVYTYVRCIFYFIFVNIHNHEAEYRINGRRFVQEIISDISEW